MTQTNNEEFLFLLMQRAGEHHAVGRAALSWRLWDMAGEAFRALAQFMAVIGLERDGRLFDKDVDASEGDTGR